MVLHRKDLNMVRSSSIVCIVGIAEFEIGVGSEKCFSFFGQWITGELSIFLRLDKANGFTRKSRSNNTAIVIVIVITAIAAAITAAIFEVVQYIRRSSAKGCPSSNLWESGRKARSGI